MWFWGAKLPQMGLTPASPLSAESAQHPSFTFETETSSDWEPQDLDFSAGCSSPRSSRTLCKAVVKGLRMNEPVQWEVTFDICPLFRERESQEEGDTDPWSETFHHLAAKSVTLDFEHLAERECEIEHGNVQLALPCLGVGSTAASPVPRRAGSGGILGNVSLVPK